MFKFKQIYERGLTFRLLWDLFMILMVFMNLHLIVFDLTYLTLRPHYLEYVPEMVKLYDPFLGIEPHRSTDDIIKKVDEYKVILASPDSPEKLEKINSTSQAINELFIKMNAENSFERAGLTANLQLIKHELKDKYKKAANKSDSEDISSKDAFKWFWTYDANTINDHIAFYEKEIKHLLAQNYYRHYGLNGKFVDKFWILDLPFLSLFLTEFLIQWWLAIKNKKYVAWFLHPLYSWYDVLGFIPFAEFRFFRLFRIVTIYIKLKQSDLTTIGDDFFTRAVVYYSNIVKEEITDMVTIRILTEMQEEIKSGASINLVTAAVEARREQIKKLVIENIRKGLGNNKANQSIRKLLAETLERSSNTAKSLALIPSPIKEAITKDIGLSIFDAMNEVMLSKVAGDKGEENISKLIDGVIDDVILSSQDSALNELTEDMTIEIIENMKATVSKKKWLKTKM